MLPFILYGGYAVGKLEGERITIENIRKMLLYSLTNPWPMRFTLLTVKAVLFLILIWGFAIIWYVGNYRSLIPGLEYGSAKFADPKHVNEKLKDADDSKNKILSQNIRMSIDTRKTGLNNNVTVIGGSGAGKSFFYVLPNGLHSENSMIFTDPKGELYRRLGNALELKGFRVLAFNLVDMDNSDCYNPFDYIRSDNDIIKLVTTNMMKNTTPKGASSSDPFWDNALSLYLQAIILASGAVLTKLSVCGQSISKAWKLSELCWETEVMIQGHGVCNFHCAVLAAGTVRAGACRSDISAGKNCRLFSVTVRLEYMLYSGSKNRR